MYLQRLNKRSVSERTVLANPESFCAAGMERGVAVIRWRLAYADLSFAA